MVSFSDIKDKFLHFPLPPAPAKGLQKLCRRHQQWHIYSRIAFFFYELRTLITLSPEQRLTYQRTQQ